MAEDSILLERDAPLARLLQGLEAAAAGEGGCLLLHGEAGVGKTSLIRRLRAVAPPGLRWLAGACEPWLSPLPLGPLVDCADALPPSLAAAVRGGAPLRDVLAGLLDLLRDPRRATVLVIDDAHWADGATLDLLRWVGRRIDGTRAAVLLSYRDDELGAGHPLHAVLGSLPAARTRRVALAPLSRGAVERWARRAGRDPQGVFRVTAGNPFFVAELLAGGEGQLPATVRDAVIARAAGLPPAARELLDWVSLEPAPMDMALLQGQQPVQALPPCVASGLLLADAGGVRFRHELARQAIEEALQPAERQRLHAAVLAALDQAGAPAARRAHHALRAGLAAEVLRWAPPAAAEASQAGAHRQAAVLYGAALAHAAPAARPPLLEARARAWLLCNAHDEAIADRQALLALALDDADAEAAGRHRLWLARAHWMRDGDLNAALPWVAEAIAGLEAAPPAQALAQAYSTRAHLALVADDFATTLAWGERAVAVAEAVGDAQALAHALNNVGTARARGGALEVGLAELRHSLDIATRRALPDDVARAHLNLFLVLSAARRLDEGLAEADAGVAHSEKHGLDVFTVRLRARRAFARLMAGCWADAEADLDEVRRRHQPAPMEAVTVAFVAALLDMRRAVPGARRTLEQAVAAMRRHQVELWFSHSAAALAEAAWLDGDNVGTIAAASAPGELGDPWRDAELRLWRLRAGEAGVPAPQPDAPALEAAGRTAEAAAAWQAHGCPYEQALALLAGDAAQLHQAVALLEPLDAQAALRIARRRLRALGERAVARGPYGHARQDPLGLTPRQREIAELLAEGLANRDIALRLHRSERTVENHVAALLQKLGARDRHDAVRRLRKN